MFIRVLGSAAGGGFPQWNCNCPNCKGFRNGTVKATARTQSSIAVSDNGSDWVIVNASPDIRSQIMAFPEIQPAGQLRDTAIRAVVLTDAQLDHCSGLLFLREGCPLPVYCTNHVKEDLSTGFSLFPLLKSWQGGLQHKPIEPGERFVVTGLTELEWLPVPIKSNAPPYSSRRGSPQPGDNVGLLIHDKIKNTRLLYMPGLGEITAELLALCHQVDCLLIEGTFWTEDEMIVTGVGNKMAAEMGHLPISGENGLLNFLGTLHEKRKILIHINNTNPILNEESPEAEMLARSGIEVSFDGMQITL
ncbi:MAG: pyrroloquinoline quinone biosynthesis protein PqqB [Pseudomonadales bacterium]|nr:pyrroloquinoline quinone biosynthesis protein PqqB [Pseudomonadales bacterium]